MRTGLSNEYDNRVDYFMSRLLARASKDPSYWLFAQMSCADLETAQGVSGPAAHLKKPQSAGAIGR